MYGGVGRARTAKSCSNARAFLRSRATFVASSRRRAFSTARRSEACSRFLLCETELAVQQWLHAQCVTIVPGRRAARSLSRRRPHPQPHHVLYFEGSSTHCFFGRAGSPLPFLCPFLFLKAIYLPATGGARAIIEIKISVIWYVKGREPPGDSPGPVAVECQVPSDVT